MVDSSRITDRMQIINLANVLLFYGVPLEVDLNLNILVDKGLYNDKDYVYNISKKSEDSLWLKEHVWKTEW